MSEYSLITLPLVSTPSAARRRRVPAMAPDERRAALIAATVPLLREYGVTVSTRQIADAAGVAEGTIFGVFPDKATLIRAAVLSALDPEPLVAFVAEINRTADLRSRLRTLVERMRERVAANAALIVAIRTVAADPGDAAAFAEQVHEARCRTMSAIATAFEPDRDRLRRDPESAARLLFMLIMSTVHHIFGERGGLGDVDSDEIVSLLLDGLLVRPTTATGEPT